MVPLIAALFNVYPQYCKELKIKDITLSSILVLAALRVIKSLYQNPETGMKKKAEYEQNIALSEPFLEAVPTTIIICSWFTFLGKLNSSNHVDTSGELLSLHVLF